MCQPVALDANGYPNGIAVDATNAYWTDLISGVRSIPLLGGIPAQIAMADTPEAIALDSGHVYWTAKNLLARAPLPGGATQSLLSTPLKTGAWALATDGTNVYWADQAGGTVQQMPVSGGSPILLAKGLVAPDGVVVDDTSVYFANGTNQQVQGSILKVTKGAGGSQVTLATGQKGPRALALDDANVYWTDSALYVPATTGLVMKAPKTGGMATILTSGQGNPLGIAVNGGDIFFVNGDAGTVMRLPTSGGTPVVVAQGQLYVTSIAADAKAIYWTTQNQGGAVMKPSRAEEEAPALQEEAPRRPSWRPPPPGHWRRHPSGKTFMHDSRPGSLALDVLKGEHR